MAVSSAPDWLMNPTDPGRAIVVANVAFSPEMGFMTPRQLGPMMRKLPFLASARVASSSAAPFGPVSLNPAEMMMAPRTPAATHSAMMPGTVLAGVTTTARSTGSGIEPTSG